ncbi:MULTISPECIES: hypothetical protein [unclassified Bradyrhizobium]|uniref:hypothetical protein n=1 Tax=unclassified Bradyrhizobium TaxID=2631580 RepID=UPI001FF9E9A2|nr:MULTISPECIES: hypothetical protein [unclassified Bradyrhizobium]MCK1289646.1 hypothetical protein [Bradyrhizobium sp. 30]MCK1308106.1 hypothetical protein [Bradyrhizobium sp. 45]MCK1317645.1 hypothetical protein [Bradyrhizobium sp. 23]MCK1331829.1 hypothetical protein [Bradyrhizobium sp. CW9]MCK1505140.1 hypothetical protein [Bradyrhizobium sp. 18]
MTDIFKIPLSPLSTPLGRIGAAPSRLMSVREWWYEMDEPVAMLEDPQEAFRADERTLLRVCLDNGIAYRAATTQRPAAFPAWLFREVYRVL